MNELLNLKWKKNVCQLFTECKDGTFGDGCRNCSQSCKNGTCDKFSEKGTCTDGCKPGYHGDTCNEGQ